MTLHERLALFADLMVGHLVCDRPLQSRALSRAKNRHRPVLGTSWLQALATHAGVHGSAVALRTGSFRLGLAEAVTHALIDDAKCHRRLSVLQDQAMHVACKAAWALLATR